MKDSSKAARTEIQFEENSTQYKAKLRHDREVKQKPETLRKIALARKLAEQNRSISIIQKEIGYKTKQAVIELLRRNQIPLPQEVCTSSIVRESFWFKETADASGLTEFELERCRRLEIKPERWAWLKKCPTLGVPCKWDWLSTLYRR